MNIIPNAFVLNAPGINCNLETGFAIENAGGSAEQVHISEWQAGEKSLDDFQILILSGGFSHGDDIASGRILGLELQTRFGDELNRFVEAGKAIVGICNGFQVLVESGLLPEGKIDENRQKKLSLVNNQNNTFECRWNRLRLEDSACRFIPKSMFENAVVELPSAHQEGRIAVSDPNVLDELIAAKQVVFRYVDENGLPTEQYPMNPNGSPGGITGVCDKSGVILGLMPHPERAISTWHHPNWRRGEGQNPFGKLLFKTLIDYATEL